LELQLQGFCNPGPGPNTRRRLAPRFGPDRPGGDPAPDEEVKSAKFSHLQNGKGGFDKLTQPIQQKSPEGQGDRLSGLYILINGAPFRRRSFIQFFPA
jgi:hypothetical protein